MQPNLHGCVLPEKRAGTYEICEGLNSEIISPFVWPSRSWRIWSDTAQDERWGWQITVTGSVGWRLGGSGNWKLGPKPSTACHAPGFIQRRFKGP
ncbi:unnamed protein product [Pleuronectes platessa]|uniref:Uncharacterized protein n=1 Tax=Pleuronectes platessa TaxID=8262 RepID=A0A9N7W1G7_PLEPL|nr:unnamed protein product [Pleuronectes platessa]